MSGNKLQEDVEAYHCCQCETASGASIFFSGHKHIFITVLPSLVIVGQKKTESRSVFRVTDST